MADLAVVIPAYKPDFFRATLESLAAQTASDFAVYVGNDGGPVEVEAICADFPELDLTYRRFEDNLGGRSLVGQWNRCVAMSTEPWIWLLSDDDVISPDCIETVLAHLGGDADVLRFDTETIDADGRRVREHRRHPSAESGEDFILARLRGERDSFVVEYLFRRSTYDRAGGFVDFPVAWCSDDASWFLFAGPKPIVTMPAGRVSWRASGLNITDANEERQAEKIDAAFRFLDFVRERVRPASSVPGDEWEAAERRWLEGQIRHVMPLPASLLRELAERTASHWPESLERRASRLTAWNAVATLKSARGRIRRALRSLVRPFRPGDEDYPTGISPSREAVPDRKGTQLRTASLDASSVTSTCSPMKR